MSVAEIQAAIGSLPPEEFARIREWFSERDNLLWDKQLEADSASGRLNFLIEEIEAGIVADE